MPCPAENSARLGLYWMGMKSVHPLLSHLLVLVFACQALVANALPCQMSGMDTAAVEAVGMPDAAHSGHHMPGPGDVSADSSGDQGCCGSGLCAMSYCQSLVALPLGSFAGEQEFSVETHRLDRHISSSHLNYSLYRPPILR